jgi:nicotinate-nucleotide adenylyltransferase
MNISDSALARLGVLGGTFDPIHVGHLIAASEALSAFALDRVLFVPAGRPWQKTMYSDPEDRHMMTVLGTSSHLRFATSRIEIDRPGASYTVDTLTRLRDVHGPGLEMFFILGADALGNLGTWRHIEKIGELCDFIGVYRPGRAATVATDPSWPRIHRLDIPGVDVSSTEIRARVREGRPIDFLVPEAVAEYIRVHGLYLGEGQARGA